MPFLQSISHSTPSGLASAHAYQRNDNGWIDLWQQFDGSQWQSHGYRYDQAGQLETDRKYDGLDNNSPLLDRQEFRFDRAGNRIFAKDANGQLNDSHNPLNQLESRSSEGGVLFNGTISEPGRVLIQQLDGSSNITASTEAALYGGNEFYALIDLPVGSNTVRIQATDIHGETTQQDFTVPVVAAPGASFLYDSAGNLTDWTQTDGTHIDYKWDAANRLREIHVDSVLVQSFEYDGAGRMTRATDASGNRNDYFWDGLERLGRENVDISPTVYRRYLTSGFTESLGSATAQKYYVTRDHLGSTREVLDATYSTITKYDYSAWGEVQKLSGSIDADRLYTGHLYFEDTETSLHLAPYRAYQPEHGRWLSRDTLGETGPDGSNVYAYIQNRPINGIDPTGLWMSSMQTVTGATVFAALYTPGVANAPENNGSTYNPGEIDGTCPIENGLVAGAATLVANKVIGPLIGTVLGKVSPVFSKTFGRGAGKSSESIVPKAPVSLGKWGEARLADLLGGAGAKSSSPFKTSMGNRYFDRLVNGVAHEAKAGLNVKLTPAYKKQILKDVELMQLGQIQGAHWHFFQGAQDDILNFLSSNNIPYTLH